jgi:hypothetical protein
MKRRGPVHNFIRFPLFPGSLLIMEGACQEDWSHQVNVYFILLVCLIFWKAIIILGMTLDIYGYVVDPFQIPKDPKVEGERISLVFRVMHAIESPENELKKRAEEEEEDDEDENEKMDSKDSSSTSVSAQSSKSKEVFVTPKETPSTKKLIEDTEKSNGNRTTSSSKEKSDSSSKSTSSSTEKSNASSKSTSSSKEKSKPPDDGGSKSSDNPVDPDIEIIAEKPSQTRIIFHNKK